ncbi:MAG: hypothetical protein Q4G10_04055 [Bacteroidia bacterium]|nr:hypothetical protein [Bacteroidia bacterium]
MNKNSNIYNVPEGYFEQLQSRLAAIPAQQEQPVKVVPVFSKVKPYIALAASFAMAFCIGNFILGRSSKPVQNEITYEDICYADLIPVTNPYIMYEDSPYSAYGQQEAATEDDILEYLVSSGASVDYIAYLLNE